MDDPTPDCAETQRLLEQVRAGDRLAFDQLFTRHRPFLRQVVELRLDPRLRARVDPSDVVQETQLEAFQRHSPMSLGQFLSYVFYARPALGSPRHRMRPAQPIVEDRSHAPTVALSS
jgi:hypothetical protein